MLQNAAEVDEVEVLLAGVEQQVDEVDSSRVEVAVVGAAQEVDLGIGAVAVVQGEPVGAGAAADGAPVAVAAVDVDTVDHSVLPAVWFIHGLSIFISADAFSYLCDRSVWLGIAWSREVVSAIAL